VNWNKNEWREGLSFAQYAIKKRQSIICCKKGNAKINIKIPKHPVSDQGRDGKELEKKIGKLNYFQVYQLLIM